MAEVGAELPSRKDTGVSSDALRLSLRVAHPGFDERDAAHLGSAGFKGF